MGPRWPHWMAPAASARLGAGAGGLVWVGAGQASGFVSSVDPRPSGMKTLFLVLLAGLLDVDQAHALMCFSCKDQKSNWSCLKPTVCASTDKYCVTMVTSASIGKVVDFGRYLNKGCSPICPGPSVDLGVMAVGTQCCTDNLCNVSAAGGGPRLSAAALGLGLLLSLLAALLRPGL
ncbi:lymphocyte antigen 6E-like [Rhynchocyon petersi]